MFTMLRQYGFIILYALMLTGVLDAHHRAADAASSMRILLP